MIRHLRELWELIREKGFLFKPIYFQSVSAFLKKPWAVIVDITNNPKQTTYSRAAELLWWSITWYLLVVFFAQLLFAKYAKYSDPKLHWPKESELATLARAKGLLFASLLFMALLMVIQSWLLLKIDKRKTERTFDFLLYLNAVILLTNTIGQFVVFLIGRAMSWTAEHVYDINTLTFVISFIILPGIYYFRFFRKEVFRFKLWNESGSAKGWILIVSYVIGVLLCSNLLRKTLLSFFGITYE